MLRLLLYTVSFFGFQGIGLGNNKLASELEGDQIDFIKLSSYELKLPIISNKHVDM